MGAMARAYCARCGRPNPEDARFCSNCGAQLAGPGGTGSMPAGPPGAVRPGETTTISLNRPDDPDLGEDLFPDSASFGALPEGSDADAAQLLLDFWADVVEQAGR